MSAPIPYNPQHSEIDFVGWLDLKLYDSHLNFSAMTELHVPLHVYVCRSCCRQLS